MQASKIAVIGGAGAIGRCLVQQLLALQPASVLVIDDGSSGNVALMPPHPLLQIVHLDIANTEKLPKLLRSYAPDYVFHLAAHFANQNSVENPFSDIQTNVVGTVNVFNSLVGLEGVKKVVYASSSCIYGGDLELMSEADAVYPYETPYAINKFVGELYARYYAHLHHLPTVSIRIFNTYGPGEFAGRYRNVIPNFVERALRGEEIVITGDGNETRDFTYITDTCQLLINAALSGFGEGEVFNGGTGQELRVIDLAQKVIAYAGSSSGIRFVPRRNWDLIARRMANTYKARQYLGYSPQVGIDEGLRQTIDWYKSVYRP